MEVVQDLSHPGSISESDIVQVNKEVVEAAGSYPGIVLGHMEIIQSAGKPGSYPGVV